MVVGGGPAGMKAAVIAAERGHDVTLFERDKRLGGQTLLAQLLPGRSEFGGVVTNLEREVDRASVAVQKGVTVDRELVARHSPDVVVIATGAVPHMPALEGREAGHVVQAWEVLTREANCGSSVVVADWRGDWIGLGVAEMLAIDGCKVRLMTVGYAAGLSLQNYIRDHHVGELHRLGVVITPYARPFGVDEDTAYFQHTTTNEAIVCEGTDTLVMSYGHRSISGLMEALADWTGEVHVIGDALSPRSCEEAVLDGLRVGAVL